MLTRGEVSFISISAFSFPNLILGFQLQGDEDADPPRWVKHSKLGYRPRKFV
jgi:hypothetical protein